MDKKVIFVDYQKCVGCGTCEMVCSLVHEGRCSRTLSRIRIVRYITDGVNVPVTCSSCENPPCEQVCPSGAISKNPITGQAIINENLCIGCRQCIQACPFAHINIDLSRGKVFKCDLCGGEPRCVEFCWTEALQYAPVEEALYRRRQNRTTTMLQSG